MEGFEYFIYEQNNQLEKRMLFDLYWIVLATLIYVWHNQISDILDRWHMLDTANTLLLAYDAMICSNGFHYLSMFDGIYWSV